MLSLALVVTSALGANASPEDQLIADLSRCDSSFFSTLAQRAGDYAGNPYLRVRGSYAYFEVADRSNSKLSMRRFENGLRFGNLQAVAYFDELAGMGDNGAAVSWGFLIEAPIGEVVSATENLVWDRQRLRKDGNVFVRSEIWTHSEAERGWQPAVAPGGEVPKQGTVERVLLIEPYEEDASFTRFGCSLQGDVSREMLRSARPDLGIE